MKKIRVLVVDDSAFLRRNLPLIMESDPEIQVIGTAANGQEAIDMTRKLRPDVITMDIIMPVMDGLTALRHIMKQVPTPVVMLSSETYEGARQTIEAISIGAIDFIHKPSGPISLDISRVRSDLVQKVKTAYTSKLKMAAGVDVAGSKFRNIIESLSDFAQAAVQISPFGKNSLIKKELVAVAASTGGPAALQILLANLPANLPVGMVIVQHISEGFSHALAERLNSVSPLEVRVAKDTEQVLPGLCLLGPAGIHLTLKRINTKIYTALNKEPSTTLHRPSADILFSSVAQVCGASACCVIMTGMGDDGALGIKEVRDKGGATIAQDEATSIIFGMPKQAIEKGGIDTIAPLEKIPGEILKTL